MKGDRLMFNVAGEQLNISALKNEDLRTFIQRAAGILNNSKSITANDDWTIAINPANNSSRNVQLLVVPRAPFKGETLANVLHKVLTKEPEPPRAIRPELHRDVETICQQSQLSHFETCNTLWSFRVIGVMQRIA